MGYEARPTPVGPDEGTDVIARRPGETVIIECKHYGRQKVGSMIVRGLVGSVAAWDGKTDGRTAGALVTSSRITEKARDYVKENRLPIDLIDRNELIRRCAAHGITLVGSAGGLRPAFVEGHLPKAVAIRIRDWMDLTHECEPGPPSRRFSRMSVEVRQLKVYRVALSYDRDFTNSSGRHIGEIEGRLEFYVEADSLHRIVQPLVADLISRGTLTDVGQHVPLPVHQREEAVSRAIDAVIRGTRRRVSYAGGNNQSYTQELKLKRDDFSLPSCRLFFVPYYVVTLEGRRRTLKMKALVTTDNVVIVAGDLRGTEIICSECESPDRWENRFIGSAGICRVCGHTLCRRCAVPVRRYLIRVDSHCPAHAGRSAIQEATFTNVSTAAMVIALVAMLVLLALML
jgi:hypothetical protein